MVQLSSADSTFLHPTGCLSRVELMPQSKCLSPTEPSRSQQGTFCNRPHRHGGYFYHWPLDRWAMTHAATAPVFASLPPCDAVGLDWSCRAELFTGGGWGLVGLGVFMVEKQDLACLPLSLYSRVAITSHPLTP